MNHALDSLITYKIHECSRIEAIKDSKEIGTLYYTLTSDNMINFHALYVHRDWRNKGIATQLNKRLIEYLQKQKLDFLVTCKTSSELVMKTLEKLGFHYVDFDDFRMYYRRF